MRNSENSVFTMLKHFNTANIDFTEKKFTFIKKWQYCPKIKIFKNENAKKARHSIVEFLHAKDLAPHF